jgi:hypothetical protein
MDGFVRNRTQPGGVPGLQRAPAAMVAPPRAAPAEAGIAPPRPVAAPPPARMERPQPSYERPGRSDRAIPQRSYDTSVRVSDD